MKRYPHLLLLLLAPFFFFLPFSQQLFYASPDETASASVARELAWYGRAWIPEPLAEEFPWLHPRSFVSQGDKIVPVGFMAWPWFISVFILILGVYAIPFLTSLAVLSSTYPTYRLLREHFDTRLAILGTIVAYTFPGLIVFANRGMFPQIALLAFGVWAMFLIKQLKDDSHPAWYGLATFLAFMTLASRPTEIIWVLPWFVWAAWERRPKKNQYIGMAIGAAIPLLFLGFHAQMTYGGFWKTGYWLRDNVQVLSAEQLASGITSTAATSSGFLKRFFPFGIHPLYMAWNIKSFLLMLLLPWTLLISAAAVLHVREAYAKMQKDHQFHPRYYIVSILATWSVLWLIVYYGQGLYTDHVRAGAVTIANSFVRYLVPLSPIGGLVAAFVMSRLPKNRSYAPIILTATVAVAGIYIAFAHDDEGLLVTRRELLRYAGVRQEAMKTFRPGDVIISERSDKIFFPAMRAVSPMPPHQEVARLAKSQPEMNIGLYARPLSQVQADAWRSAGFEPVELGVFAREKLYLLQRR